MISLIENKKEEIKLLCAEYRVANLFLYGSALTDNFKEDSDLDFAVVFKEELSPIERGGAFFSLLDELELLLGHKIDLISYGVIKNPIFKKELDRTKIPLYAAA